MTPVTIYLKMKMNSLQPGERLHIGPTLLNAPKSLRRWQMRKYLRDNYLQIVADGFHFGGHSPGVIVRNKHLKLPVHYVKIGGIWRTYILRISE